VGTLRVVTISTVVIIVGPNTSQALAPHARERSWVMFVQIAPPSGIGPIKIEGARGAKIGERLLTISVENPYPSYLIGLIESASPHQDAHAIAQQYAPYHMHDGWFEPHPALLQLVQQHAQPSLAELLAQTRPGAVDGQIVDVDAIAAILGVSVRTVRRLVAADGIPHMRVGKQLRFVVADVLAAMNMS
jgi:excisionase family DNA binding protein